MAALFSRAAPAEATDSRVLFLPADRIRPDPHQPRRSFSLDALRELAQSIQQFGILQPLTVRREENGFYRLIAGERRLRAAKLAGLSLLPCILREADDREAALLALLENLQREDLDFFEEADALRRLIADYGLTQEQLAAQLQKSQPYIANKLRLQKLSPAVRAKLTELSLTERHARTLLRLPDEEKQLTALDRIEKRKLNVAQTEQLVERLLSDTPATRKVSLYKDARIFINTINHALAVMKNSGIEAVSQKNETEEFIEYSIRIPKLRQP